MAADNPIVKVISSGPGYTVVQDSTGATVKRAGSKNWRNNNPGNIASTKLLYGAIGFDTSGGVDSQGTKVPTMLVFATYQDGQKARQGLLFGAKSSYVNLSLHDAIERYAGDPKNHTIDISGYENAVARALRLPTSTVLNTLSPSQQQIMLEAMEKYEGWKVGTITVVDPGQYTKPPSTPAPQTVPPAEKPAEEITPAKPPEKEEAYALYPLENRLKKYPSYIYALSLHLMTAEEYNNMVEYQTYTPKRVLVASAGRWNPETFPRSEFFADDFYFEDLTMTTVIGPNDVSRNTNAIDVSFTLIEPYGFTMVERLLKVADSINSKNYLDMSYMLQIDFFAMDDSGNIVGSINELRKLIPIKIVKFDTKVSARGSEYRIAGVPFGHSAFDATSVTTPANFEVTAGTVSEFFQSVEGTDADVAGNQVPGERAITQDNNQGPNFSGTATPNPTAFTKVNSFGTAINLWYKELKNNNKTSSNDIYRFEFDDTIGKSRFTDRLRNTPKETPMKGKDTPADLVTMKRSDLGSSQNTYDTSKAIFQINYGTTIEKLLEYIIRSSDYIQEQIAFPEDAPEAYEAKKKALADQPLNWFKIVPTVRLLEFDDRKKLWSREITYHVVPYKIYNLRSDLGPQGVALHPVKEYNYIYTGKNDDVFDFDINFNALYYTQVTAYRDSLSETAPSASQSITDYQSQNAPNYTGGDPPKGLEYNAVMPLVMKPVVQNSKAAATGGATSAKEVASVDLADSLMTNSQADMVNIKLKILGDPDFIKQDDIFYRPGLNNTGAPVAPSADPRLLPNNGSLAMDNGIVYAQVLFRTPRDIDESTGLMEFDSNYQHSLFSGMYQVLQVTSNFRGGQFTQELDLVRVVRQTAFDYVNGQNKKSDNRSETGKPGPLGVTEAPPVVPSLLVSGGSGPASPADAADGANNQTPGQDQRPETPPPAVDADQAALMKTAETAPTAAISDDNKPVEIPKPISPSEEKKAAEKVYFDFLSAPSQEKIDAANYDTLGSIIERQKDDIATIEKNVERLDLRLERTDITEEQRKAFTDFREREIKSLEIRRASVEKDITEREKLKPIADAWNAKVKELREAKDKLI